MKRIKRKLGNKIIIGGDTWNHFYGIIGLLSLIITGVYTYYSFQRLETVDHRIMIQTLSIVVGFLTLTFISASIYYTRLLRRNEEAPYQLRESQFILDQQNVSKRVLCRNNHTINHYFRNIIFQLDEQIELLPHCEEEEQHARIDFIVKRVDNFMNKVTSSLQQYFSTVTGYTCSITIKHLNPDLLLVKTFYRDPLSHRRRVKADRICYSASGSFELSSNKAYFVIADEAHSNVYFANDNLTELYNKHGYANPNKFWHEYYNACIAVPISRITGENTRNILGFLVVDNLEGNLNNDSNVEYLLSVADLLYLFMNKYLKLTKLVTEISNDAKKEEFKRVLDWS